ncbi:LsmAD domain-containing protein [Chytriomyces sp. MP71]|nr:LsmAD domain-containing protein [Chytriomyces sp. MP71]
MHKSDVHRGGSSSVSGRGRGGSRGGFSNSSNAASVGGSHANSGPQSVNGHSTDSGNSRGGRGKGSWSNGPPPGARGSFGDSKPSGYGQPVQQSEQLERIYSLFMYMVGTKVIAVVKNNAKYEGILRTAVASPDMGVILDMARLVVEGKPKGPVIQCLAILPKDLLSLSAYGLEVTDPTTNSDVGSKGGFETDAAIGSRVGNFGRERELVQWASDVPDETNTAGLDDHSANTKWDQFATNERLFGVETDFQEDIYTTVIDRSDPNFKRKEADAQRIAKEIEAGFGKTDNIHLLEEQNLKAGNDGAEDEESKYSSVMRKPDRPDNAYVPPGARRAGAPAEPGKVKPDIAISISSAVTAPKKLDYAALNTAPASTKPIAIPDPQQPAQQGENLSSTAAGTQSRSGRVSPAAGVEGKKSSPMPRFEGGKAGVHPGRGVQERKEELLNRLPSKGQKEGLTFSTRPDFVGEIRGGFQKFAEGQRAQIKKPLREALTKPRPDMFSELKAFSTNFKVPMPFPADLKEIIKNSSEAESRKLPSESVSASTSPKSAKKAESSSHPASFSNERSVSEIAPPSSQSITAVTKTKLTRDGEEKMDMKDTQSFMAGAEKSKFKFNLGAAEFTPSFRAGSTSPSAQSQGIAQDRVSHGLWPYWCN